MKKIVDASLQNNLQLVLFMTKIYLVKWLVSDGQSTIQTKPTTCVGFGDKLDFEGYI